MNNIHSRARNSRRAARGFSIVELMVACDVVVTLPGATTCGEARAVGRRLVLLDAMPGHGRENLQHELELGGADACNPRPSDLTASVLAALDRAASPLPGRPAGEWDRAFAAALASIGVEPGPRAPGRAGDGAMTGTGDNGRAPQEATHP